VLARQNIVADENFAADGDALGPRAGADRAAARWCPSCVTSLREEMTLQLEHKIEVG
jgi:hypothetical protein